MKDRGRACNRKHGGQNIPKTGILGNRKRIRREGNGKGVWRIVGFKKRG